MRRHRDAVSLSQMLDYAREAVAFMMDRERSSLDTDRMLFLALRSSLEILGEAANRLSPEIRSRLSGIPWTAIIGTRNRLIHGYDSINLDLMWTTLHDDMPPLIAALEAALQDESLIEDE